MHKTQNDWNEHKYRKKRQLQEYKSVKEGKEFKEHIRNYDMNSADNVIYHLGPFTIAAENPSLNEL